MTEYFANSLFYQIFKSKTLEVTIEGEEGPFNFTTEYVTLLTGNPLEEYGFENSQPCRANVSLIAPAPKVHFHPAFANISANVSIDFFCQGYKNDPEDPEGLNYHQVVTMFYDTEILAKLSIETNATLKLHIDDFDLAYTNYNDSYIGKIYSTYLEEYVWGLLKD